MNAIKKTVIAAALTLGVVGSAQADVLAQNVLQITNLLFLNPNGSIVDRSQFSAFSAVDNADHTASLAGVGSNTTNLSGAPAPTFDLAQVCFGTCVFAQNDFSSRPAPATINVARSDSLLLNAPITGLGPVGGPFIPTPATATTVAEAQLISNGSGTGQTNLGLNTEFTFALVGSQTVTIQFNASNYLIAHMGPGETGQAQASSSWVIEILQTGVVAPVFRWAPDQLAGNITGGTENADNCALNASVARLSAGTAVGGCSGLMSATTGLLVGGTQYTLTIRHASFADVDMTTTRVPEPGSLALLGLGALGLAAFRRRKMTA